MERFLTVILVLGVASFAGVLSASVTPSVQCPDKSFDDLQNRIQVIPCGKTRCKLRRGNNITVNFQFNPKYEVTKLENSVFAIIASVPLPFLGVTGSSACDQVRRAIDDAPVKCPLPAGQEYKYTKVIPVENFYPTVDMRVHWSLIADKGDVICFEVPAVITNAKKTNN